MVLHKVQLLNLSNIFGVCTLCCYLRKVIFNFCCIQVKDAFQFFWWPAMVSKQLKLIFIHDKAKTFARTVERNLRVFWRAWSLNIAFVQMLLIISPQIGLLLSVIAKRDTKFFKWMQELNYNLLSTIFPNPILWIKFTHNLSLIYLI